MPTDFFIKRKPQIYNLPVDIPRFFNLREKTLLAFRNDSVDFYSKKYYDKGRWKFTIKQHGEGFYLEEQLDATYSHRD